MQQPDRESKRRDNTLLLGMFISFLFSPPLLAWWASPANVWYLPFLLWLGIILLIAWVHHRPDVS